VTAATPSPNWLLRKPPGVVVAVGALVDVQSGDARAVQRAGRVAEDDAGGRVDAVRVERDAGDVDRDRSAHLAEDADDVALVRAEARVVAGDAIPADALRLDRDEVGPGALESQALLDDQCRATGRARALGVGARADEDRVAGVGVADRAADRAIAGGRTILTVVVDRERGRRNDTRRRASEHLPLRARCDSKRRERYPRTRSPTCDSSLPRPFPSPPKQTPQRADDCTSTGRV